MEHQTTGLIDKSILLGGVRAETQAQCSGARLVGGNLGIDLFGVIAPFGNHLASALEPCVDGGILDGGQ